MRCPDCSKFVSMENADPEVQQLDVEYKDGVFYVSAEIHHERNCADCGTALKSIDAQAEAEVELKHVLKEAKLSAEEQDALKEALEDGSADVNAEEGDTSVDESGGGRYAKNMITVTCNYTISISVQREEGEPLEVNHNTSLESENAASYYEECC